MSDAVPWIQDRTGTREINEFLQSSSGTKGIMAASGKATGIGSPGVPTDVAPRNPPAAAEVPKAPAVTRNGVRRRSLLSEEEGGLLSQAPTYRRSLLGY